MPVWQFKRKSAVECDHHMIPHDEKIGLKVPWQDLAKDFSTRRFVSRSWTTGNTRIATGKMN
jgi:hypothetical protein